MNAHSSTGSPVAKYNLTEQALLDDVAYLERYVGELSKSQDANDQAMLRTYTRLLENRRRMLASWNNTPAQPQKFVPLRA